jgi:hypothetical protein
LIGVAALVFLVNVLARLTMSSQADRIREQRALETVDREGHWPGEEPVHSTRTRSRPRQR